MRALVITPLVALAACTEYTVQTNKGANEAIETEGVPDIAVDPMSVDFGSVEVVTDAGLQGSALATVTVSNEGDDGLEIYDLYLEDTEQPFTLSGIGTVLVPAKSQTTFTVTFEPRTAEASSTRAIITSNDPDEPEVVVDLTGLGTAPLIQIDPASYDYGNLYIGCDQTLDLVISNVGNDDLVIDSFDYITASNDLDFDDNEAVNGDLPWTLAEGGSLTVKVNYAPLDEYADEGYLKVASNDPMQPEAQAYQVATGSLYGENLDEFVQPTQSSADILFVVDNSCSMVEEQTNLANNFEAFIAAFSTSDSDFQIGVITTDNASFRGDIIRSGDSNAVDEFTTQTAAGVSGSGDERGLQLAYEATQSGADAGPGSEFLRDEAKFSIVIVSDETDHSSGDWSDYVTYWWSLKDDADNAVVNAIAGDYPGGCATAEAGGGYYEASAATGGLFLSICATDWSSHLESLAENARADLSQFELSAVPVPETIEVRIDSVTTTTGWTFNDTDNAVDFDDDHIPDGGATIEIEYALYGDCAQ
jgi:hypothetical protein